MFRPIKNFPDILMPPPMFVELKIWIYYLKTKSGQQFFIIGVIRCYLTILRFFKVYIWFWHMFTMYKMAITIFRCFSCSTYFNFFFFLTKIAEYLKFETMGSFCNLTLEIHIRGSYSINRYLSQRTRFGIYFSMKKNVN